MTLEIREQVADDSRMDILRAAACCFMDRGYTATSIDDVARSLGATKGQSPLLSSTLFTGLCRFALVRYF